jgi:hypothetical protein
MKSKRRGVAISTDGKVLLSFQQQRSNETQLEAEDLAAHVRAQKEVEQAQRNQGALVQYLSAKYALSQGDQVTMDGAINRKSRELTAEGAGGPR